MTLCELYQFRNDIRRAVKIYGEKEIGHTASIMTEESRQEFDNALIETEHPLAYQAGTFENRLREFILKDFSEE